MIRRRRRVSKAVQECYPKNPRQARIWNYLNSGDDFYVINSWPCWLAKLIMQSGKNNLERMKLFRFLVYNGLYPETAKQWVLMDDVDQKTRRIKFYDYDKDAYRQMDQLKALYDSGVLAKYGKVYDMMTRRPINVVVNDYVGETKSFGKAPDNAWYRQMEKKRALRDQIDWEEDFGYDPNVVYNRVGVYDIKSGQKNYPRFSY
jgi:hypothetical protein